MKRECGDIGIVGWQVMREVMGRFVKYYLGISEKRKFINITKELI